MFFLENDKTIDRLGGCQQNGVMDQVPYQPIYKAFGRGSWTGSALTIFWFHGSNPSNFQIVFYIYYCFVFLLVLPVKSVGKMIWKYYEDLILGCLFQYVHLCFCGDSQQRTHMYGSSAGITLLTHCDQTLNCWVFSSTSFSQGRNYPLNPLQPD